MSLGSRLSKHTLSDISLLRTPPNHYGHASTIDSSQDKRWSEVVPPDAALGFVAVYDPEEGLMTFSGHELVASPKHPASWLPSDEVDDRSQVLTIDRFTIPPGPGSNNTAMMTFLRDNFDSKTPIYERYRQAATRASSGIDVHLRETESISRASKPPRHWSLFSRLNNPLAFDPRTAFNGISQRRRGPDHHGSAVAESVTDEGYSEGRHRPTSAMTDDSGVLVELNLSSAFSVSTASTSNFIYVEDEPDNDSLRSWSAMETPEHDTTPTPSRRRLRKRRPAQKPAPAEDVLSRTAYGHETPPLPPPPPPSAAIERCGLKIKRMASRIGKRKSGTADQKWVCVEVQQVVTQRLVE